MHYPIRHEPENQRFVVMADGHTCLLDYRLADEVMSITHTRVPEAVGGRGIAGTLTSAALAVARENGWKVNPVCSYAQTWFKRHPQEADVLVS